MIRISCGMRRAATVAVTAPHISIQPRRHARALCRDMHRPFGNLLWSLSNSDISTPGGHFIQANISSAATLERRRMEQQVAKARHAE
jgi:hypothetical protein